MTNQAQQLNILFPLVENIGEDIWKNVFLEYNSDIKNEDLSYERLENFKIIDKLGQKRNKFPEKEKENGRMLSICYHIIRNMVEEYPPYQNYIKQFSTGKCEISGIVTNSLHLAHDHHKKINNEIKEITMRGIVATCLNKLFNVNVAPQFFVILKELPNSETIKENIKMLVSGITNYHIENNIVLYPIKSDYHRDFDKKYSEISFKEFKEIILNKSNNPSATNILKTLIQPELENQKDIINVSDIVLDIQNDNTVESDFLAKQNELTKQGIEDGDKMYEKYIANLQFEKRKALHHKMNPE